MNAGVQVEHKTLTSYNPADGSVVAEFRVTTAEEVHAAVVRAKSAQKQWAEQGLHARLKILVKFQRLLLSRKEHVAELISREAGKPIAEAMTTEVLVVLDVVRFLK